MKGFMKQANKKALSIVRQFETWIEKNIQCFVLNRIITAKISNDQKLQ